MKTSRNCPYGLSQQDFVADTPALSRVSTSYPLSNIQEESPSICLPLLMPAYNPPEIPQEPMEFLSRSWSISALEVTKALNPIDGRKKFEDDTQHAVDDSSSLVSAPFSFASAMTAQIVMERILSHSDISPLSSRRNSYSSGPLSFMGTGPTAGSPPLSPRQADNLSTWLLLQQNAHPDIGSMDFPHHNNHFCRSFSGVRAPLWGMSMKRWIKDMKERKKEAMRMHNSQVHAAMSVAGVAAAIAAIATSTATASSDHEGQNRTSMAVASAASLVAAQCVEIAESMGADHEQMSSVVSSAVSVKTSGDIITLTAAAATALRAAATLKARTFKHHHSHATVIPYERGSSSMMNFNGELVIEDSETEFGNNDFLRRGCEFLKRTSKGELHWRSVFVYINKHSQVVVKSQSKCLGITKSKKRYVRGVVVDIPAWPGRKVLDGMQERRYFGIKTDHGVMELECKNETEYQLWTKGISRLLALVQHQQPL